MATIWKPVRVFVSSTFCDMQTERNYLVKFIFPQLRKMCEERAVRWTEVDLRWGITDEQKAEGKVLPLCLEEIHRCRPYFIGLLGDRYGWVPDSIPAELLESHQWLKQYLQHSVTELEILHGVFSEEQMNGHAYFYFRDTRYVESVPAEKRQDFTAESPESAEKLQKLKQKIRYAHDKQVCRLREGYANPEQLGEWILEDFTALINTLYPKEQVPDALDQEAAHHEAYALNRRLAFVRREDLLRRLNEHAYTSGKPIVLIGESGCGKSALLAEWIARWRKNHPDDLVIQHYIGSTPDSADWQGLVRRILGEIKRALAITDDIPLQPEALRDALNNWMVKAAGSRRFVFVLDGLNQLADDSADWKLGWLPVVFPTNFHVLVSSLPGETVDVLRKRGWPELNIPLFTQADIGPAALTYFKMFGKTLTQNIMAKLESTPAACNALYLRTVLDELRQFGQHEELEAKAAYYLSAPDLPELLDRVLTRWQADFGRDPEYSDLVRRSLCLIACARFGLIEVELLDLLGENGNPLPRRPFTPFYLAAENALVLRAGKINFGHEHLRAAVQKRWLEDARTVRAFRRELAKYFARVSEPTDRKLDELPTLLSDLMQWSDLKDQLTDIPTFLRLTKVERWRGELHRFWLALGERFDIAQAYWESLGQWHKTHPRDVMIVPLLNNVGKFMRDASHYDSAESFLWKALDLWDRAEGIEKDDFGPALLNLGAICDDQGRTEEAEIFFRKAVRVHEKLNCDHPNHAPNLAPNLAAALNGLAKILVSKGDLETAQMLQLRALAIVKKTGGGTQLLGTLLHNIADRLESAGDLTNAEQMCREALQVRERYLGPKHPDIAQSLSLMAILARRRGDLTEAERFCSQALEIDEQARGDLHPTVGIRLNCLALVLKARHNFTEAEKLLKRAVMIGRRSFTSPNPDLAVWLNNLAGVLVLCDRQMEAVPFLQEALEILDKVQEKNDDKISLVLDGLSDILLSLGRREEAFPVLQRTVEIHVRQLGIHNAKTFTAMANLGVLLLERGGRDEATRLLVQSLAAHVKSLGKYHPQTMALAEFLRNSIPWHEGTNEG